MTAHFSASFIFVFLRGHHLLESYFAVSNSHLSANDSDLEGGAPKLHCRVPEQFDYHGWD